MISDINQRIEVKRLSIGEDFGFGGSASIETSILITWASIKEISRKSATMQGLLVDNLNYKMTIRYTSGRQILKDDVIIWQSKRYKAITGSSVNEIGKKKFLEALIILQDG